jgi:hypothetical protein
LKQCPLCGASGEVPRSIDFIYRLRQSYKPETVNLLFIGESPPQKSQYFYLANSNLFRCIQQSFRQVVGSVCGDGKQFLDYFKRAGCFLDDLCILPINGLTSPERRQYQEDGITSLVERISGMSPKVVVIVGKGIEGKVQRACSAAFVPTLDIHCMTFPAFGRMNNSNIELSEILNKCKNRGIF